MFGTPDRYTPVPAGQHLRDHARPRAAGAAIDLHLQRPRADLLQLQRRPDAVGRHGRPELGGVQPHRRPVVGDAGLRPAAQVHGERARRGRPVHPGAERGLRQGRPVGPAAVRRPGQRPGLLALFRLCAAIRLRPVLPRALRHAPGPEPGRQQDLQLRRELPARAVLARYAGRNGLVVRRDGLRPAAIPRSRSPRHGPSS